MIRDAAPADLDAVTALYSREVLGGTATFELDPPSLAEMTIRFNAIRDKGLPWLVAEVDGVFAGYAMPRRSGRVPPIAMGSRARSMSRRARAAGAWVVRCCQN